MDYKQYIIVRKDLEMTCGKTCVQVSHASLDSYILSNPITRKAWHNEGQRKIVLQVDSEKEILDIEKKSNDNWLYCALIYDLGLTELAPNTLTACGIEIETSEKLEPITKGLKLCELHHAHAWCFLRV